jgi:predicted DNA-binding WGR domain protein
MPVLQRTRLECTTRGHSKEYLLELESNELTGTYRVRGQYGRIGSTLTDVTKCDGVTYQRALAEYEKTRREKVSKGYVEIPVRNQYTPDLDEDGEAINDTPPAPLRRRAVRPRAARPRATSPSTPTNTVDFYDEAPRRISL